eukprot:scaffold13637_cov112-Isochrysis_galbana.AAC.7
MDGVGHRVVLGALTAGEGAVAWLGSASKHIGRFACGGLRELLEPAPTALLVRLLVTRLTHVSVYGMRHHDDKIGCERGVLHQVDALVSGERGERKANTVVVRVGGVRLVEREPLVREEKDLEPGHLDQRLRLVEAVDESERADVAQFFVRNELT